MDFNQRLEQVIAILKDKNVTPQGKENVYNDFLEEYPYFDSSKLDNLF